MKTFYEFGLDNKILKAINDLGFEEATPIQAEAIPVALSGKDIIGQAQTGTGKTIAFGIPIIQNIEKGNENAQAIVIAPTRELAMQVAEELNKVGQFKGVYTLPIYGGQDINRQIKALKKKPQIIVGTPGRLIDHLNRKTLKLNNIKTVVLDEADEMLNMGFIEDIEEILKKIPEQRQVLLFSATMPKEIKALATNFMKDPTHIHIKSKEVTVENIEQNYIEVKEKDKFDVLTRLLDIQSPELAIVFGRTKRRVDELAEALTKRGYLTEGIHGDLTQARRDIAIKKFKEKTVEILVATDVASRGLDISGVTHIYNFDIPQDPESYVHRIGRTGRAGRTGLAITFVTPREIDHLKAIERITNKRIKREPIPTMTEAIEGQQRLAVEQLLQTIEAGKFAEYKGVAEDLLDKHDSVTLVSAALKILTKEPESTPIKLTEEMPLRVKKQKRQQHQPHGNRDKKDSNKHHSHRRRKPAPQKGGQKGKKEKE